MRLRVGGVIRLLTPPHNQSINAHATRLTHHLTNTNHIPTRTGTSIYLQRRPFHPDRFADFVEQLSAASYTALENAIEGKAAGSSAGEKEGMSKDLERIVTGLLRSKGFLWLACTDQAALYYSHAGKRRGVGGYRGAWCA